MRKVSKRVAVAQVQGQELVRGRAQEPEQAVLESLAVAAQAQAYPGVAPKTHSPQIRGKHNSSSHRWIA